VKISNLAPKILYALIVFLVRDSYPASLKPLDFIIVIIFGEIPIQVEGLP